MAVSSIGGTQAAEPGSAIKAAGTASDTDAAAFENILAAFEKEAAKTPAERARDHVLKKHGLTEDSYRTLPPERKKAIDAEIATAVQRAMRADTGKGFRGAESAATVTPGTNGWPGFRAA
jgi:hypothetical protein